MSFEYYRKPQIMPFPRSLNTTIRAFRNDQAPLDVLVFRAGSVDTLGSRPLNVHLVQETMAASGLDPAQNSVIAKELFEQLGTEDLQLSDFCAQSLVRLEERYYRAIRSSEENLQEIGDGEGREAAARSLALLYLDFAEVLTYNTALQRFYLERCRQLAEKHELPVMHARALLALNQAEDAERVLRDAAGGQERPLRVSLLIAEAAFRRGDFDTVLTMMAELKVRFPESELVCRLADYWLQGESDQGAS